MKCLIVDDNDFLREALKMYLADHAEIETACNGREAVERFNAALDARQPFDLVLLDIMMPEIDGQQALKMMRQAEKENMSAPERKAVIIMTTALNSLENMQEALWDGDCNDYLVKPVARGDLFTMLRRYQLL